VGGSVGVFDRKGEDFRSFRSFRSFLGPLDLKRGFLLNQWFSRCLVSSKGAERSHPTKMRTSVAAVLLVGAAQGVGAFMPSASPCLRAPASSRAVCAASKQSVVMQEQGQASRREAIGTVFAAGLATLLPGAVSPSPLGRTKVHICSLGAGHSHTWLV